MKTDHLLFLEPFAKKTHLINLDLIVQMFNSWGNENFFSFIASEGMTWFLKLWSWEFFAMSLIKEWLKVLESFGTLYNQGLRLSQYLMLYIGNPWPIKQAKHLFSIYLITYYHRLLVTKLCFLSLMLLLLLVHWKLPHSVL